MTKLFTPLIISFACLLGPLSYSQSKQKVQPHSQSRNAKPETPSAQKGKTIGFTEAIKRLKGSIIKVRVQGVAANEQGQLTQYQSSGTGFFINDEAYIITNNHVVEPYFKLQQPRITIGFSFPNELNNGSVKFYSSFVYQDCDIISIDKEKDLALLKVKRNPFKGEFKVVVVNGKEQAPATVPRFSFRKIEDGDLVAVSGYPLDGNTLITSRGSIASAWLVDGKYNADMIVNPGNSGGPVYLQETGEIIGVAVSFTRMLVETFDRNGQKVEPKETLQTYNSGISQIIPISHVLDLISKQGLTLK